jgi:hypothetical protein
MKKTVLTMLLFLMVGLFLMPEQTPAAIEEGSKPILQVAKATADNWTRRTLVNIGQVAMWIYADGISANMPNGNSGLFYPRGSTPSTAVIFQDGLIWGGIVNDGIEPKIRIGGQAYTAGTVAGAIISKGVAENLNDQRNVDRVWRIRRDFVSASDDELRQDAAEFNSINASAVTPGQIKQMRDIYLQDWLDWPVAKGAPFYDANGDGQYTPTFAADGKPILYPDGDEPGYANGDQVVWFVCNDLSSAATIGLYGSPPIGMEMQCTLWAYKRSDAMGQIIFKEFRVIYKGRAETPADARIDSMYFCQWSDPDLGEAGDDYAGCDTTLSLGFCYNATSQDVTFSQAGLPPAASGYDFFAGPRVPDPNGEAIWHLKKITGYRNLPMTSFAFFAAGQEDSDPTRGGPYDGTLQWWNLLRGYRPRPISPPEPWINKVTGERTMFRVPGDPVAGTGWLDANPGDRRILLVSGPFTMALGDTNETVLAVLGALGSDRLSSVSVLKFYDRFAQEAFDLLFELPKAPPSPKLMATEFDGEILLNWGFDQKAVEALEGFDDKGFKFQGYNVYQLPSAGAAIAQSRKLATFDVIDEVTTIVQETFEPNSGQVLALPVQTGKNSGILRKLAIDRDVFRERPLANGRTYYFGVTAYSYNTDPAATVKSLESTISVVTVVPQTLKPGERLHSDRGDTLKTVVHDGLSDGSATVVVVDPTKVTGHDYKVIFIGEPGPAQVWHLLDTTTGDTVLKNQTNQTGDNNYLMVDGLQVVVVGAALDFKDFQCVANASGPLSEPIGAGADWYGFPGLGRPSSGQQTNGSRWLIHTGDTPDGTRYEYSTFVARVTQGGSLWSVIVPNDFEMRFTGQGGIGLEPAAFTTGDDNGGTVIPVPFELWMVGDSRVNDPSDDIRMIPYLIDNNANGKFDYSGLDHSVSGGDNDPETDWVYWQMPNDRTPGDAGYQAFVTAVTTNLANYGYLSDCSNVLRRMVLVNWNGGSVAGTTFNAEMPETGTIFRIITNKPNTPTDVFTFTTSGFQPTKTIADAQADIEAIKVFPNPYYGFNIVERDRFQRFVTFNHLPQKAIIRIFSLAGVLVRTITKDDPTQFATWNLENESGLPVASGIYVVYIDMPDLGKTKTTKLAIIREQQFLPIY